MDKSSNSFNWEKYIKMMETQDLIAANDYRHSCVPKTLYKFYPNNIITKRMAALREKKLWLAPVSSFNDPFEFSAFYYPNWNANAQNKIKQDLSANFRIASLTTQSYRCPIMWAHYGGSHTGFCVEYEIKNPRFIWNVYYSEKRLPYGNGLYKMLKNIERSCDDCIEMGMFIQQLAYKSKEWAYEQEYRIIIPAQNDFSTSLNECGEMYRLDAVGLKTKAIYAGWKTSEPVIRKLEKSANIIDCEFYKTTLSSQKFEMEILKNGPHEI